MASIEGSRARVPYDDCICSCHFSTMKWSTDVDRGPGVEDRALCDPCQRANDRDTVRYMVKTYPAESPDTATNLAVMDELILKRMDERERRLHGS